MKLTKLILLAIYLIVFYSMVFITIYGIANWII